MNYPLIKKFLPELRIDRLRLLNETNQPIYNDRSDVILASDLNAELAKGIVAFSDDDTSLGFATKNHAGFTHQGLVIGLQPIENQEPVSREEIRKALDESQPEYQLEDLLKRILKNGVR